MEPPSVNVSPSTVTSYAPIQLKMHGTMHDIYTALNHSLIYSYKFYQNIYFQDKANFKMINLFNIKVKIVCEICHALIFHAADAFQFYHINIECHIKFCIYLSSINN